MDKDCEYYMERYLELDKNEKVPSELRHHFMKCSKCRNEVKALSMAEKIAAAPLKIQVPLQENTIADAVRKVAPEIDPQKIKVPIFQWILYGIMLIAALIIFASFSDSLNRIYSFALYLVFGAAICGYFGLFIGTNLDFFVKKIETGKHS